MSVVLAATAKLVFQYTVDDLPHKLQTYMAYNDVLGQHQMVDRDGITTVLWTVGAQYLWDKFRQGYNSTDVSSPASVSLFHRSGSLWNLVDVSALTGVGASGSATSPAQQFTWVLRDTAFKFVRFLALETIGGYVGHYPVGIGGTSWLNNITYMLSGADTDASAPYRWLKSRGDRFLAATGTVAGLTADSNDALRRARGLV